MVDGLKLPTVESVAALNLNRTPTDSENATSIVDNPFLQGLAIDSNNTGNDSYFNEVLVNFYKYQPLKNETVKDPDTGLTKTKLTYGSGGAGKQDERNFYINCLNDFDFTHSHEWGSDATSSKLARNGVANQLNASNLEAAVSNFALDVASQVGGPTANFDPGLNAKVDIQKTYKGGTSQEGLNIRLEFELFTSDNFYRDILIPITLLTYLTYPRRRGDQQSVSKALETIFTNVAADSLTDFIAGRFSLAKLGADVIKQSSTTAAGAAAQALALNTRIYYYDAPYICDIQHMSGLFNFQNCAVRDFSVKYSRDKMYFGYYDGTGQFTPTQSAYPAHAHCSLNISTLDAIFADDFLIGPAGLGKNRTTDFIGIKSTEFTDTFDKLVTPK